MHDLVPPEARTGQSREGVGSPGIGVNRGLCAAIWVLGIIPASSGKAATKSTLNLESYCQSACVGYQPKSSHTPILSIWYSDSTVRLYPLE